MKKDRTPEIRFEHAVNPFEVNLPKSPYEEEYEDDDPVATQVKAVFTPMGLVVLPEKMAIEAQFNMWTCHTNYNVIDPIVELISNVDGVELLDIQTRYRFRLGIGKLFSEGEVIAKVRHAYQTFWNHYNKNKGRQSRI